jgi:hypothetical protein
VPGLEIPRAEIISAEAARDGLLVKTKDETLLIPSELAGYDDVVSELTRRR